MFEEFEELTPGPSLCTSSARLRRAPSPQGEGNRNFCFLGEGNRNEACSRGGVDGLRLVEETGEYEQLLVEVSGLSFVLDTVPTHLGFLIVPGFDHFGIAGAISCKQ